MKKVITTILVACACVASVILIMCMCNTMLKRSGISEASGAKDLAELEEIDIRISACNSESHPQTLGLYAMKDYVERISDGKITVSVFPNGQLGDEEVSLTQVQAGTLEMCTSSIAPITTFQKKFSVLDIPFLFSDYEEAWMVLDSKVGQGLMESLNDMDLKGLAWMENGFRHITTKSKPVNTMADLKGVKIRTMNAPMHILNFQTLGANPTPVNFSELYMAMSQNIVDGQENPIANVWDLNMYEVQKYVSLTGHIYDSMPLICNLSWWNNLPAEYQTIIQEGAMIGQNYSRFCNYEREDELRTMLTEKGMEFTDVTDEAKEEMKNATQSIVADAVKEEIGAEYVDTFLTEMEEVKSDILKGVQ